jgi:hypothetical protein
MRVFLIAAAALLITAPAAAQGTGGKGLPRADQKKTDPNEEARRKAAEKAYNDALAKIPDAKQDRDPWRGTR